MAASQMRNQLLSELERSMLQNAGNKIYGYGISMTFMQLYHQATQLSKKLCRQKYGILCESDVLYAQALLACMIAGVTAVPLSNRYGNTYNERIIKNMQLEDFILQDGWEIIVREGKYVLPEDELKDVVLIPSTSGSMGRPKGVMLTYASVYQNICDSDCFVEAGRGDKFFVGRGFSNCSSIIEGLFINFILGIDIYCMEGEYLPRRILMEWENEGITMCAATTTAFYYLCQSMNGNRSRIKLRYCCIGGEKMSEVIFREIRNTMSDVKIVHSYGMTETCSRATYQEIHEQKTSNCVGTLLASLSAKIVDQKGRILPANKEGQLLLSGPSIMKGYYRESGKTREAMQEGWLQTGEIAWMDKEKRIYIEGRKDEMIIKGGMNIYPQEIEQAILKNEEVNDIYVYAKHNGVTGQVAAEIVLKKGAVYDCGTFMKWCTLHMPMHQIPDQIYIVEQTSKKKMGKI